MHHRLPLLALLFALPYGIFGQISFSKNTELLTPAKHYSGIPIAVLDMNGDGRDDIVRLNGGQLAIENQTAPGYPFHSLAIGEISTNAQWGICAADIDNNGRPDILVAGDYDNIKTILANADGSEYNTVQYTDPLIFAQAVNLTDLNNDGWLDAFLCHDDGTSPIFMNIADGSGALVYAPQTIDFSTVPTSDNSGNYGAVWCDMDQDGDSDLYISKCRQGVDNPNDGRRLNQLFRNNGDGTFSQDLANTAGLRIGAQSWASDFGDIDNDGDFDCFVINHYESSQLLENDGSGHFTDITPAAGLFEAFSGFTLQSIFRDFDNDGYVDLLIGGAKHHFFRNNGDKTFSTIAILDTIPMWSFALGDLNSDGFQDIYAAYGLSGSIPDELWLNHGNTNHYFGMSLRGVLSNRSAVGTKVFLYSALGTQVREVRSGESYGIMNSMQIHFGMGQNTAIDSVVVHWPSGLRDVLYSPAVDQYMTVVEGICAIPQVHIEAAGNTVLCSGDSILLEPSQTFHAYHWSTGDSSASIAAKTTGLYAVTVTTAEGCTAVSNAIPIVVDPVEVPSVVVVSGDTTFCVGGAVVLRASPSTAYLWNTGDTTDTIVVSQAGDYFVQTQGLCAAFISDPIHITVLTPDLPVPTPDTVAPGASALLTATGDQPIWFDMPADGTALATGHTFSTPPLGVTTTYWVANFKLYSAPNQFVGMKDHEGTNVVGPQTDGALIFDCYTPVRLLRTKVYSDTSGIRKIVLRQANGTVLQSIEVHIPAGTSVLNLDFDLPADTDLWLATDTAVNTQMLGYPSPRLRRSDVNVNFPYAIPGYLSIKTSNLGTNRYYYFYDWEVELPEYECLSDRVPVTAVVDSTMVLAPEVADSKAVQIFPNPTAGYFWAAWNYFEGGDLLFVLYNAQGIPVRTQQRAAIPTGELTVPLDTVGLPAGIYWLELTSKKSTTRKKVILH